MPLLLSESDRLQVEPYSVRSNLRLASTLALVLLLAWGSIASRGRVDGAIAIWPANGLLLALLLTTSNRKGLLYLIWGLLAYAVSMAVIGLPSTVWLRAAIVNATELLIARTLLCRFIKYDIELSEPGNLWRFALLAAILAPLAATLISAFIRFLLGQPLSVPIMVSVFLAHGLGILTMTPLALEARRGARQLLQKVTSLKCTVALAVLVGITVLVFWQTRYPLLFLIFPPLVGVVVVGGLSSGALGLSLITVIAFAFTIFGHGPAQLMNSTTSQKVVLLQCFIAAAAGLTLALANILAERDRAEAALQAIRKDLEHIATIDSLTGLSNRRRLDAFLDYEFRRAVRESAALSVLMIDIDRFKLFNDRYGHLAGDDCLRAVGEVLRNVCRRPGDLVARYGGEEFAIVLGAEAAGAQFVAEAVRAGIENLQITHAGNTECGGIVTLSIGVATLSPVLRDGSPEEMLRDADDMLYEAKRSGRNRCFSRATMPVNPVPPPLTSEVRRAMQVERVLQRLRQVPCFELEDLALQAAALMHTPIGAVTLVAEKQQIFAGSCGLDVDRTGRDVSFCAHAITGSLPLVVTDATLDPRFCDNALVTGAPFIRFYAGAPIISRFEGHPFGAVCVISDAPREAPSEIELAWLTQLAARAADIFEREMAGLQEQDVFSH